MRFDGNRIGRWTVLSVVVLAWFILGCGAAYAPDRGRYAPEEPAAYQEQGKKYDKSSGFVDGEKSGRLAANKGAVKMERKVVYTAWFTVAVYEMDKARKDLVAFAESLGGYLQNRKGQVLTVRIPGEHFRKVQPFLHKMGKVDPNRTDIRASDVTEAYMDLTLRLATKKRYLKSLQKLLDEAGKLKDKLAVQKEIGRLVEEIEALEGKLRLLEHRIALATITVTLRPAYTGPTRTFRLPWGWLDTLGVENLIR